VKVCLINYRYFVSSGPERYLFGVKDLLEARGHEVIPFSVRYGANEPTPWAKYFVEPIAGDDEIRFRQHSWTPRSVRRALERAFYSREVYDALSAELREGKPDVAYVLHYMRKLSPAVLQALHDHGVPIAVRFSDFAMVCPQAHLIRDDQICELCVGGSVWPSVRYGCVQGSRGASAVNALAMRYARRKGFFDLVDAFVAPSAIMREKMIEGGLPAAKLHLLPTFVRQRTMRPFAERRRRISFAGRVERLKGVHVLLAAFDELQRRGIASDVELVIAGDLDTPCGRDLRARLHRRPIRGVTLAGQLDGAGVVELLQSSLLSVVPSLWYENSPNSLLESLACGTPVVAADLGSMRDALFDTGAGLLTRPGDHVALAEAM
jgi:glycosyltransferase involved in cell wall biosynthesis